MWDAYGFYIILGFIAIAIMLMPGVWASGLYVLTKHRRFGIFLVLCGVVAVMFSLPHEQLRDNMAHRYYSWAQPGERETMAMIATCRSFVQAHIDGQNPDNVHKVSAGFITISHVSYWDVCARTFGMNYWRHDISINGENGGQVLCHAYHRASYQSPRVDAWCDTVFAAGHNA